MSKRQRYPISPALVGLLDCALINGPGTAQTRVMRARSFTIAWTFVADGESLLPIETGHEYMVLLPDAEAVLECGDSRTAAPRRSVCVMPPGSSAVRLSGKGECIRIFGETPDIFKHAAVHGFERGALITGPKLRPTLPYDRTSLRNLPEVNKLDELPNSRDMPRAKLFQTSNVSINWVEYVGPRDRKALSPHFHTDFEQGSIAIEGEFVHHFRRDWVADADQWEEDTHIAAPAHSIAIIPPPVIHTTEGIGPGRHILIDVFSPPRGDFIKKGQILNSSSYEALRV